MRQLKFDNYFKKIEEEPLPIWNKREDIPEYIIKYFDKYPVRVIFDDIKYYCPFCLKELNDCYCDHCKQQFNKEIYLYVNDINNIKGYQYSDFVFTFDVINDEVILYVIKRVTTYNNPNVSVPFYYHFYKVYRAFHITKKGIKDLLNNNIEMTFAEMHQELQETEEIYILAYDLIDDDESYYLYVDNLDFLKNTIYKYTKLWKLKDYLLDTKVNILNIIYAPLYNQDFEFLIKNKLYNMAFSTFYLEDFNNKLKKLYKDNKEFIIKNNLDYYEFKALELIKCQDLDVIKFVSNNIGLVKDIKELANIDFVKLKNIINEEQLYEYYDYLDMASKLGFNLKDKNILYPKNFIQEHNKAYKQMQLVNDPNIDKNIKKIAKRLEANKYEDKKYVIYPAPSIDSLIEESSMQNNCVRMYASSYSQDKTHIYFMREKSNINKSFVTIEVKNNKIVQARIKNNDLPSQTIENILKSWEKTLKDKKKNDKNVVS